MAEPRIILPHGPRILNYGGSGSGKTHAIRTLVEAGVETFVLATEPGIENVLGDLPPDRLHWHYLPPTPFSLDAIGKQLEQITNLTYEALCDLRADRSQFRQMLDVTVALKDFPDDRTGKRHGPVTSLRNDQAFVIDSFTGLCMMMINATIGTKPVMAPQDYNVAQTGLERFINSLCMILPCWFVLNGHVDKELHEESGRLLLMVSGIGKKLGPKLPRFFDEVLYSKREGSTFYWSNLTANADTKKRLLPFGDKLPPSYAPLLAEWRKRNTPPTTS